MPSIGQLDVEILGKLTQNARAALAAGLGVSRSTVQFRLRRLESEGILLGSIRSSISRALVVPVQALVTLEIDQTVMARIVHGLKSLPEVLEVRIQAGREDLLVHVAIGSLDELQVLTAAIVEIDGVRPTTSTFTVATPIPYRVQPLLNEVTQGCEIGPLDARPTLGGPVRRAPTAARCRVRPSLGRAGRPGAPGPPRGRTRHSSRTGSSSRSWPQPHHRAGGSPRAPHGGVEATRA